MKKNRFKHKIILPLLCYAFVFLFWLGTCTLQVFSNLAQQKKGLIVQKQLSPQSFSQHSGIKFSDNWQENSYFISADTDPQLHLTFENPTSVGQFVFAAQAKNKPSGEIVLYYTTRQGQAFNENKKVLAQKNNTEEWFFDLNGKKVFSLRLDPDSIGGVYWEVKHITINMQKPLKAYFTPDPLQFAVLLFFPLLLAAILTQFFAFFKNKLFFRYVA